MRRMYSEKELTDIIKKVSEDYIDELIEDGVFDQDIADYVDAYLVEHPVDITALEGKDISPDDISATGNITGASIIENMSGYSFSKNTHTTNYEINYNYASAVKNGNKLTCVIFGSVTKKSGYTSGQVNLGTFTLPTAVANKLYPYSISPFSDALSNILLSLWKDYENHVESECITRKSSTTFYPVIYLADLDVDVPYLFRYEVTFLLSDNLIEE